MSVQHSAIVLDADNHEPKGAPTALVGKVYVANGAGSGTWSYPSGTFFADMYIDLGATAQTLSAASAYAKLDPGTEWHAGVSSGCTINATTGEITLTNAGTYSVDFWISFDTASLAAGTKYYFKYAIDGVTSPRILSVQKNSAGADRLTCAASGLATVTAGQVLSIHVAGDGTSSSTNITVADAGVTAVFIKA